MDSHCLDLIPDMKNRQSVISIMLLIAVNVLFVLKYSLRFLPTSLSIVALFIYVVSVLLLIWCINHFHLISRLSVNFFIAIAIIILLLLATGQYVIDPLQLQVDRWSAIHNFIDNLFHGVYPYAAQTHLGGYGSPFPVWQLFHLPFYLMGNVGWSFVVGILFFLDASRRVFGVHHTIFAFILLVVSPAFLYEVMVRSDLLTNFMLSAAIIMYFKRYNVTLREYSLLIGITIGLIASTRLSAVIPFAVYFFRDFMKVAFTRQITFIMTVSMVFVFTFLPFVFWNSEMLFFFEYNPFILQSRQGNLTDFLVFIPVGIWLSLSWNGNFQKYLLDTASILLLLVVVTFVHNMYLNNNWGALFASDYDITYFNMSIPFLITASLTALKRHEYNDGVAATT